MRPPLVVVVAFNGDDLLAECLAALEPHQPVVVVDNGDQVSTRLVVGDRARYVPASENRGFAAGVNIGLQTAWDGVRDVLLLNPDARLTSVQLGALQRALHDRGPRCAAIGPLLQRPDGTSEPASWPMPSPAQVWMDTIGRGRHVSGPRFVTGAALLLRGDALAALGRLDERYFLYAEETDWQMRALRAGWEVAVDENTTAIHVGGASSDDPSRRAHYFHRSGRIFAERWYPGFGALSMRLGRLVGALRHWVTRPASRPEMVELIRICVARGDLWRA